MTELEERRRLSLICPACDEPSSAYVYGSVEIGADPDAGWLRRTGIFLVLCEHCAQPALMVQEAFELLGVATPSVLWPVRQRTLSAAIPWVLREELEEARVCFKAKAYRAAAVMVRRTLEGFCQDQGAPNGRTLHSSLSYLRDTGVIDGRLFEWAQGLKALGNAGAHHAGAVDPPDARDALELAEALLDYVYVFSAKFTAFQRRRSAPSGGQGSILPQQPAAP